MIWESRFWKDDLLRFADRLRTARTKARPFSNATYVSVEKSVLLGAFAIRRLAESHKLSDATSGMSLRVTRVPSTGRRVTLLNNHRLDELFDFSKTTRGRAALPFLCNQAIHSYVFTTYPDRAGKRLSGVFIASDRQRSKALFAVPLAELERAFRRAGKDYPTQIIWEFDERVGDYAVSASTIPLPRLRAERTRLGYSPAQGSNARRASGRGLRRLERRAAPTPLFLRERILHEFGRVAPDGGVPRLRRRW